MDDSAVAIKTVEAGAAVVRARFGTVMARVDKGWLDFATDADVEAERAMITVLRAARPDDAVVGEESGRSGRDDAARVWLLDPLCGTANFAARTQLVAVNAARSDRGRVDVAAVADPFTSEVFWTNGSAAYVRRDDHDTALTPDSSTRLVELNVDPPFPSAPAFRAVALAADDRFQAAYRARVVSTSLSVVWVAAGRRAASVTDGDPVGSVHFSAAEAICRAAGCVVTDLRGAAVGTGPGLVVAADADTHAALIDLIGDQFA